MVTMGIRQSMLHFFFCTAFTLAHLARCAAAIRARAAVLIVRGPRLLPVSPLCCTPNMDGKS